MGIKDLFHEGIIVVASGKEAQEEEDLAVQRRDGDRLQRVAFFFPL